MQDTTFASLPLALTSDDHSSTVDSRHKNQALLYDGLLGHCLK